MADDGAAEGMVAAGTRWWCMLCSYDAGVCCCGLVGGFSNFLVGVCEEEEEVGHQMASGDAWATRAFSESGGMIFYLFLKFFTLFFAFLFFS